MADYIRRLREQAGLSQNQLAKNAQVDQATVNRIESGLVEQPNPHKLARIAQALNVSSIDLFGLAGYTSAGDLPSLPVYLRTKYGQKLSPTDRAALLDWIDARTPNTKTPDKSNEVKGGSHENNKSNHGPTTGRIHNGD